MIHAARALDLVIMLGCMNESSLGIAQAAAISPLVDVVDLDGHLLNANDFFEGLGFDRRPRHPRARAGPGSDPAGAVAVKRYVMLCEGAFDEDAKTATGVLRYADAVTVAVIDSTRAGSTADAEVPGLAAGIPIVATLAETLADRPDTLLIGVAPAGGKLPPVFRSVVKEALERGLDVENGLHDFLAGDPELAAAAAAGGAEIRDLRRPPADLDVPTLANLDIAARTVLTVGSDCALGKMTVCLELDREARRRGLASQFVPTGQTGIAIAGWGIAVDEVVSDYIAGAAERLVLEGHRRAGDDALLWIEGQGSINHPFYSGVTTGLIHGSAPACAAVRARARADADRRRSAHADPADRTADRRQRASGGVPCVPRRWSRWRSRPTGCPTSAARDAIAEYSERTGLVTDDPVRFGAGRLLDAVVSATGG